MPENPSTPSRDHAHLAREAYRLAEKHRDGGLTRDEALDELAQQCLGFSAAEYREALARGLLESR